MSITGSQEFSDQEAAFVTAAAQTFSRGPMLESNKAGQCKYATKVCIAA
jgi:hypothetical protein